MRRYGRALNRKTLGTVLAVILVAGAAWAAESQTVAVPPGSGYTTTAVLIPGPDGGDVFIDGTRDEREVAFSVGFGSDGLLRVNGEVAGPYDPVATYRVTVVGYDSGGNWMADTTVVNENTGVTEYVQVGHVTGGKPATFTATALDVISLTCN